VGARTKARKRALDVLYESELRGLDAVAVLGERLAQADPPIPEYAVTLVEGVLANKARIDELLASYAVDWPLARMPAVDRNLLRIGTYELLWCAGDVPEAVAISEAVELATSLSTDESPKFVNGVLARVATERAPVGEPSGDVRGEVLAGDGGAGGDEVGGRTGEDDPAAVVAGAGAEVEDPVGVRHDGEMVLDYDDRLARVDQPVEQPE
jgi:N utilization substance protein B